MRISRRWIFMYLTLLLVSACYKESDYDEESTKPSSLFEIVPKRTFVEADGKSEIEIVINNLPLDVEEKKDSIFIACSNGFLNNGRSQFSTTSTKSFDESVGRFIRSAAFSLRSSLSPGDVVLTVKILGVTKEVKLLFVPALPEAISFQVASPFMTSSFDKGYEIIVQLTRKIGVPSLGTESIITFQSDSDANLGRFASANAKSDSSGKCKFLFFLTNPDKKGDSFSLTATSSANPSLRSYYEFLIY